MFWFGKAIFKLIMRHVISTGMIWSPTEYEQIPSTKTITNVMTHEENLNAKITKTLKRVKYNDRILMTLIVI